MKESDCYGLLQYSIARKIWNLQSLLSETWIFSRLSSFQVKFSSKNSAFTIIKAFIVINKNLRASALQKSHC